MVNDIEIKKKNIKMCQEVIKGDFLKQMIKKSFLSE